MLAPLLALALALVRVAVVLTLVFLVFPYVFLLRSCGRQTGYIGILLLSSIFFAALGDERILILRDSYGEVVVAGYID